MPNRAKKILIIDKDDRGKQSLKKILERYYIVLTCDNRDEALLVFQLVDIDILLLKPIKPFRASEIIKLQKASKDAEIFIVMDKAFLMEGEIVFKDLVKGFISRPFDARTVLEKIGHIQEEADKFSLFPEEDSKLFSKLEKFGSGIIERVRSAIHNDFPVLICGEPGTGKGEIARVIHENSIRSNNPFFRVGCKALKSEDLEKALFGYFDEFGKKREGKLSLANKGTLFIEDIESMALDIQLKFLDFLERGNLSEINEEKDIPLNVRVVASTSKDIVQSVIDNEFLEELYLRLSVIIIHLQPIRKRKGELPRLIEMIMKEIRKATGLSEKSFPPEFIKKLQDYDWPGNIVELETAIKRGLVLTKKSRIANMEGLFDKRWKKSSKRLRKDFSDSFNELLIQKFSNLMSSIDNLDVFLGNIIEVFSEIMDIKRAAILLLEDRKTFVLKSSLGFADNELGLLKSLKLKQNLPVFQKLPAYPPVVYRNDEEKRVRKLTIILKLLDASLCIPLIVKNEIIGLYIIGEKRSLESYSPAEVDNLLKFATQTTNIIGNLIGNKDILRRIEEVSVVLEKAQWGVLLIDNKGVVTNFNSKVLEILDYEEKDILKKRISVLDTQLEHIIMNAIKEGRTYLRYETRWMSKSEKWIPVSVGFSLLKDHKGNTYGGIIVFYDLSVIDKSKIVKKDLSEYKIMDEMATRLAHVVKNPLVSIKTFLQLWPEKFTDSEFRVNYYNVVLQEVDKLNNFVEDISRLTYPLQLSLNRNDINDIINSILLNYKEELLTKKIEISEEYLREIPEIKVDKKELTQALSNIIINAIQSMQKGGLLSIRSDIDTVRDKKYIEIQISDTGCGIPKDSLKNISIPFYTTKPGSLGLGLAIASKIVGAHKGKIIVRSSEDKGSTFIIFIPIDL